MFKLIVLLGLVAATLARPQVGGGITIHGLPQHFQQQHVGQLHIQPASQAQQISLQPTSLIPIVNPVNFVSAASPDGSSLHGFQTIDGQTRQETVGADGSRRGSYSYPGANGQMVTVHYIADQHGFRSSNDPVSIALGSTAPRPSTTTSTTAAPVQVHHQPLGGLSPQSPTFLSHFGFQPFGQPQSQNQISLTGR